MENLPAEVISHRERRRTSERPETDAEEEEDEAVHRIDAGATLLCFVFERCYNLAACHDEMLSLFYSWHVLLFF
jgi:hypothetical protein